MPEKNLAKTNILISHGAGFWSTSIWATAGSIASNREEVDFYLVEDYVVKKAGENFIQQFDAIINPGAADSYPKFLKSFTKHDCSFALSIEQHFQNMLMQADKFNIPYLGICAGAQHLAMYYNGSLEPVNGYLASKHKITFAERGLSYFMSLTKNQQKEALQKCEFPEISFTGSTYHNFAALRDKLGINIELGAISEEGVAMAYASNNGMMYATQYHPELYYNVMDDNSIPQKSWLDNFIDLAQMHHEYRVNNAAHPMNYYARVKDRLDECITEPSCLGYIYGQDYYEDMIRI